MSNKPQNFKGMRDHLPAAMILRQHIIATLSGVFERHGFEPLQTPIIEYARTLEGKIGDEEALTMAERGISTINEMLSLMRTREILRQLEARRRIANDNT